MVQNDILILSSNIQKCRLCSAAVSLPLPLYITDEYMDILFIARNPGLAHHGKYSDETHKKEFLQEEFLKRYESGLLNSNVGKFYNAVLQQLGMSIKNVAITNICKCAFENNRELTNEEINNCLPWLERQLRLLNPRVVVLFGNTANKVFVERFGNKYKYLKMPHPTYLEVYNPSLKEECVSKIVDFIRKNIDKKQLQIGDF